MSLTSPILEWSYNQIPSPQRERYDAYEDLKAIMLKEDTEISLIHDYFNDAAQLEANYAKEHDKLRKKYQQLASSNGRTWSTAVAALLEYNVAVNTENARYKDQLLFTHTVIDDIRKSQENFCRTIKDQFKPVCRHYTDQTLYAIPKAKKNFYNKTEAFERETKEDEKSGQKLYKTNREMEQADLAYRQTISQTVDVTTELESTKKEASLSWEMLEKHKAESIRASLSSLITVLKARFVRSNEALSSFTYAIEMIDIAKDSKSSGATFLHDLPKPEPIFYENCKTHESSRGKEVEFSPIDMIFGLSLDHAVKNSSHNGIPKLLCYCFEAIERLETEGVYRISPQKTELMQLRSQAETNVYSIPYMDKSLDINVLTGLVKLYLRELPEPIFNFAPKDRAEYSNNLVTEERIVKLKGLINELSEDNRVVLKAIVSHVQRVVVHCATNKMTISNMSMIFSAILFQSQEQHPVEPTTSNWFSKQQPAVAFPVMDLNNALDMLKVDLVIEDLVKYGCQLFEEAPYEPYDAKNFTLISRKASLTEGIGGRQPPHAPSKSKGLELDFKKGKSNMKVATGVFGSTNIKSSLGASTLESPITQRRNVSNAFNGNLLSPQTAANFLSFTGSNMVLNNPDQDNLEVPSNEKSASGSLELSSFVDQLFNSTALKYTTSNVDIGSGTDNIKPRGKERKNVVDNDFADPYFLDDSVFVVSFDK